LTIDSCLGCNVLTDNYDLCAEQRVVQEGSSPSGARMRGTISKSGSNVSAGRREEDGREKPNRARRRKPDTAKADLNHFGGGSPEGRVSTARWNPKGMRRSTGP
jgi:hypothetical protein